MGLNKGLSAIANNWNNFWTTNRLNKEQRSKQNAITDVLLSQDLLSDTTYQEILSSDNFKGIDKERRQKIKDILKMLNQHFKEHNVRLRTVLDDVSEQQDLVNVLLSSMQSLAEGINKEISDYDDQIAAILEQANRAFQSKDFNKALLLANTARNLTKPFTSSGVYFYARWGSLKNIFSKSTDMSDVKSFAALKDKMSETEKIIKSYAAKFDFLYSEAEDILRKSNARLKKIHKTNTEARDQVTIDGSPSLIVHTVNNGQIMSNQRQVVRACTDNVPTNGWELETGRGGATVGFINRAENISLSYSPNKYVKIADKVYSIMQTKGIPKQYVVFQNENGTITPAHDRYFLSYNILIAADKKPSGIEVKYDNGNTPYETVTLP